jgi:hypothetical protein
MLAGKPVISRKKGMYEARPIVKPAFKEGNNYGGLLCITEYMHKC